jgi:hypothetical protein
MDATQTRWPSDAERATDSAWVTRTPRPKAGDVPDVLLPARQQQWDEGKARHDRLAELSDQARAGGWHARKSSARRLIVSGRHRSPPRTRNW